MDASIGLLLTTTTVWYIFFLFSLFSSSSIWSLLCFCVLRWTSDEDFFFYKKFFLGPMVFSARSLFGPIGSLKESWSLC
jgi:hypothetical protein